MPGVDPERSPFGYKTGWVAVQSGSADHLDPTTLGGPDDRLGVLGRLR